MTDSTQIKQLTLYHFKLCPFCIMVNRAIKTMGVKDRLDIGYKNIKRKEAFRKELIKGGGKQQVPCLRIDFEDGKTNWLYESTDIINYLADL